MTKTIKLSNGTIKLISIIVITLIALGSIIWGFAEQSSDLDHVVEDVTELETVCEKNVLKLEKVVEQVKGSVNEIDKSVLLIQNDIGYIQDDVETILLTQEAILKKME